MTRQPTAERSFRRRPRWVEAFLVALYEVDGEVKQAAELVGVGRRTVYDYRDRSTYFAAAIVEVHRRITAERAARARRRAS